MTSFIRSAATAGAAIVIAAGAVTGVAGPLTPARAAAATPAATPAATATATPAAAATPVASPTAAPAQTAAPTAAPATGSATDTGAGSSTGSTTGTGLDVGADDPSLAAQNKAGDHSMGSTIPASDPAALKAPTTATPKLRMQAQAKAVATKTWPAGVKGLDVSAYQPTVDWKSLYSQGARFAYIKATEGTTYSSSRFAGQYNGAYAAGLVRGAYHFATPNTSSGAAQAAYFVKNGGGWSADGKTLPPLLDVEYGYNGTCWGLSPAAMVKWIADFSNTVLAKTGTRPAIYTTANWWNTCTGSSRAFSANPFFVAQYPSSTTASSKPASLGASWSKWTLWQWSSTGPFPGDSDVFNGTMAALTLMAKGGGTAVATPVADSGATLASGARLTSGKSIQSSNGQYTLGMQSDGNAVLRGNGRALWQSGTPNNAGGFMKMQSDGNLVVYSKANKALWYTRTDGAGSSPRTVIQSNGDLQVVTAGGIAWRNGAPGSSSIVANTKMTGGHFLHDSTGLIQTIMQPDGNFVVYVSGKAKFNTRTNGLKGSAITLQSDGNLVLRDTAGKVRWLTKTSKAGAGCTLSLQSDGNLVLRNKAGKAVWSAGSHV
ncbi:GH25 family lysozyme [Frondihabitans peucedani]|uniref:Bulb-type lectin domain-containing protein n=1 Tax=Frondihabitans peucedani TaxID=598626 RepID=A0ABP8E0U6_9MICO